MSVDLENAVLYDFTNSYPGKTAFTGENDVVTFFLATGKGLKSSAIIWILHRRAAFTKSL